MRTFVCCELPQDRAAALAVWAARATGRDPALRLAAIDALHLTLCFVGSLAREDVPAVEAVLRDAVDAPPALRLGAPTWLPPRRPHVLAAAIEDVDGALGALRARVAAGLGDALGLPREERPFLAHVTVARVRRGRAPRGYEIDPPDPGEPFAPDAVTLMRSTLAPSGAEYEPLVRIGYG